MIVIVDFDGTCVTHDFPEVGKNIGASPVLRKLVENGHQLILFTVRSGKYLQDALDWFKKENIPLWGINENPQQYVWTGSPKPYGHYIIDDTALGCPTSNMYHKKPYVDWYEIAEILQNEDMFGDMTEKDWDNLIFGIDNDISRRISDDDR